MRRTLTRVVFASAVLLLPLFAGTARACQCLPLPPPYEAFRKAKVVFTGKAINANVPPADQLRAQGYTAIESVFRFVVEESFKGVSTAEVEVTAGNTGTSCYWGGFEVGESYLIYGYDFPDSPLTNGALPFAGACTRSNVLAWAQDELHYLRSMLRGAREPRVYGSVTRVDNSLSEELSVPTPLKGVKVVVEGGGRRFVAVTDERGRYSLAKVPDGRYKARPLLPDKYRLYFPGGEEFILGASEEPEYPRQIRHGASAYASFRVGWKNDLSGRVLDSEGTLVKRAEPALYHFPTRSAPPLLIIKGGVFNVVDWKYQFYGLTPGRYVPSVSIEAPFKSGPRQLRFYYPGTTNPNEAGEVDVRESGSFAGMDVKLPPPYLVREIEGVAVWPDGRPLVKGSVRLAGGERLEEGETVYVWDDTDEQGRFSLQGFVGAEYWVSASVNTFGMKTADGKDLWDSGVRELNSRPLKVTVGKVNEPLRLVIQPPEGVRVDGKR
ncbi:MAG: hypothetical protein JOZ96_06215 [Acidobacteria bacterium]|nr:hypothetical protein [Acidobacteriota bacterium]